jgi:hypothetical protein
VLKTTVLMILLAVVGLMGHGAVWAADTVSVTLRVDTAGTLATLLGTYNDRSKTTHLKLSGFLNGTDITIIREMAGTWADGIKTYEKLSNLDLSEATIVAGGTYYWIENLPSWMGPKSCSTVANQVSAHMFDACYVLQKVILPTNAVSIGDYAFNGCTGLTSVSAWEGVANIGTYAFNGCSKLTSFSIPNSVTSLGVSAFKDCSSMTSLSIPDNGTFNFFQTLTNCTKLTEFQVSENNQAYSSMDGILCSKDRSQVICFPAGRTSCTLPDTVTSIADNAFSGCKNLTSLTLSDSLVDIGTNAFKGCAGLINVRIPEKVKTLPASIFMECLMLASIDIPARVTSIGSKAFYQCYRLSAITLPDSLILLGEEAFLGCYDLMSIYIPYGVKTIPIALFNASGLTTINLPENLVSIEESAFSGCSNLTTITLPLRVKSIPNYCFMDCKALTSITLPDSLTIINQNAFVRCTSLKTITLPNSLKTIGNQAFSGCTDLRSVYCNALNPPIATNYTFQNVRFDSCRLFIPTGSIDRYKLATGWSAFLNMEEPSGLGTPAKAAKPLRIIANASLIQIEGAEIGDVISIYSILGILIKKVEVVEKTTHIWLPSHHCCLIRTKYQTSTVTL